MKDKTIDVRGTSKGQMGQVQGIADLPSKLVTGQTNDAANQIKNTKIQKEDAESLDFSEDIDDPYVYDSYFFDPFSFLDYIGFFSLSDEEQELFGKWMSLSSFASSLSNSSEIRYPDIPEKAQQLKCPDPRKMSDEDRRTLQKKLQIDAYGIYAAASDELKKKIESLYECFFATENEKKAAISWWNSIIISWTKAKKKKEELGPMFVSTPSGTEDPCELILINKMRRIGGRSW